MNVDIKEYAKNKGIPLWKVANELKINDGNFSRKLRFELSQEEKEQIFKIIDDLAKEI